MGRLGLLILASAAILISFKADAASSPSQDMVRQLMQQPPAGTFKRNYSAAEILKNYDIRSQLNEVSVDHIRFRSNRAQLNRKEYPKLKDIAQALKVILSYNAQEFFLIEGHTDAPGNKAYNRKLSYLRALNIKQILANIYGVPANHLAVAGYGEEFLKVKVRRSEPRNRRVTFRRITAALMSGRTAPAPMARNFMPALQRSGALPFNPPNIKSPFAPPMMKPAVRPKPKAVPFVPRLLVRPTLPFNPPNVMKPF